MKSTQAVLVVSFGTSHLDTLQKSIFAIEKTIGEVFPQFTLRRAFTSGVILKKLREEKHLQIDNVPQALSRLEEEGFTRVVIQPTHMLWGEEYTKLCRQALPFAQRLSISIGTPLLTSAADYQDIANAITEEFDPPAPDEAIIFMGHGMAHHPISAYTQLEQLLHHLGWKQTFIGTVMGDPQLSQIIAQLKKCPEIRRVRLLPLMVVAGNHVKNDMADTKESSWRCQLEAQGYEVSCVLQGLGEYTKIRCLFAQHALNAQPLQCRSETQNTQKSC